MADAAAAVARPPRIEGDWTDDRTPVAEHFYPPMAEAHAADCRTNRRSSVPSALPNRVVRGRANHIAITYGNRRQQARAHLGNSAGLILPFVNKSMEDVLVDIVDVLRMLFVAVIPSVILANKTLGNQSSRPKDHVAKSKGNIAAQIIKIFSFGLGCNYESLLVAITQTDSSRTARFVRAAVAFVCGRLNSADYDVNIPSHRVTSYVWPNFIKVVNRRADHGVWSARYVQNVITRGQIMTRTDAMMTKGVFMTVAIYCEKMIDGFASRLDGKPHHMMRSEYEGDMWNRLVGTKLYVDPDAYDSDDENTVGDDGDDYDDNDDEL
jgi:hypothetical protein